MLIKHPVFSNKYFQDVVVILLVLLVSLLRATLNPYLGTYAPFLLYTLPVVICAFYFGFRSAMWATFLGAIAGTAFFIGPAFGFHTITTTFALQIVLFLAIGSAISMLGRQLAQSQQAFLESEQTAKALLESATQAVVGIGEDGHIRIVNKAVGVMFGYKPESLLGKELEILIPEPYHELHRNHRAEFFHKGDARPLGQGVELTGLKHDGTLFPIEASLSLTHTSSGPLAVSFISDISKRKEIENALARERSQLRSILTNSPILVTIRDLQGKYILVNPAFAAAVGLSEEAVLGKHPHQVFPAEIAARIENIHKAVLQSKLLMHMEETLTHPNGTNHTYLIVKYPALDINSSEPFGVCTCMLDITEQKAAELRALHAAQHDPLTGLPNRSLIYEFGSKLLHLAQRHGTKVAVLFFDLDRFKPINDTYGHEIGDRMLQEVARRLREGLRSSDVIGRIGGDEFVAIIEDLKTEEDIIDAANHLLDLLRRPYHIDTLELRMSPSIGISLYPDNDVDMGELIRQADAAMYQAKTNGRNTYQFFNPAMYTYPERAFELEQQLRHSMTENDFELYYQPIVDTRTEHLVSVEALLRWHPKNNGIVLPGEFIPAAETSGIINQLGQWVIQQACIQHALWLEQGFPPFRIAVNVSPLQFRSKHFHHDIARAIADSGIDSSCIELEVTESTVMQQVEQATQTLASLKDLGVRVALDDFGTGYSSLSHLSSLPIDKLKVDQSFIKNIESDPRSLAIAETVIALGKKLNVEVVAEGIESEGALQLLAERECDLGQGYYIGPPMSCKEFERWYEQSAPQRLLL